MKTKMAITLAALATLSMILVTGCTSAQGDGADEDEAVTTSEAAIGTGYMSCAKVDQSSAGFRRTYERPFICPSSLNATNHFNYGHAVEVISTCGEYAWVKSRWLGWYGWMRRDALSAC